MKKRNTLITLLTAIFIFLSNTVAFSQTQPFPANKVFGNGLMATNRNSDDAKSSYDTWKTNFIEACSNGRFRVKFDNKDQTVSEGIGYGMLLTAYKADRATFDGLWKYYKDNTNGNGVMNWKINGCSGVIGQNAATDAELDAAMALIVADFQWGSSGNINYKNDAKTLIAAIKKHEVESGTFVLKPGDMFGGSKITNPSYFAPGYYRAFGAYTNDIDFWNKVADKAYTIINDNLSKNKAVGGIVSDWCEASGNYSNEAGGYHKAGKTYFYDAARTPWRIVTDYLWYGNTQAKTYSKKCSDFVRVTLGGTKNIKDGYNQDGTVAGQYHNATFVGAFACAAMAGENQKHLDESYTDLKSLNEPNAYFNQTLKTLYQFLLSGNFYLPSGTLGLDEYDKGTLAVDLFPNPNTGKFTINAPLQSSVTVLSPQGSVILEKTINNTSTTIDLSNQASGLYFVKVAFDGTTGFKKVVVN
jgi:endoglucanase